MQAETDFQWTGGIINHMKSLKRLFALLKLFSGGALPTLLFMGCLCALGPSAYAYPRTPDDLIEISCGEENQNARKILIAYDTIHGSTAEVAERIGTELCARGFQVDVRLAVHVSDIDRYDAVIIGSAIYEFNWLPGARSFIKKNRKTLAALPVAYFIVCSALYDDTPENREAVREAFVDPVLAEYPDIKPVSMGLFGGAVDFNTNQYTFFEKVVLKILGKLIGFTDHADWRDWEYISAWTHEVGALLQEGEYVMYENQEWNVRGILK